MYTYQFSFPIITSLFLIRVLEISKKYFFTVLYI